MEQTKINNEKRSLVQLLSVLAGAIILCTPAFLNNYPFLYPDTGSYLVCAFNNEVSEMRPITYGLFMRHASVMESLWLVIFIQALVVSWLIHRFLNVFFKSMHLFVPVLLITLLTLMTGVGEVMGMLMPDFASPIMILCLCILLFGDRILSWKLVLTGILLLFSVAFHHSNIYTAVAVILFFVFLKLISKEKILPLLQSIVLPVILVLAGYFTIPLLHQARSGEFFWSKAKNIFITNRINQMGLLKPFLREHCASGNYALCPYVEEIPFDFLWDMNSPLNKTGGWTANNERYGPMLQDFFKKPYYVKKFAVKTIENGVLQFFTNEGKVIFQEGEGSYVYNTLQQVWSDQVPAYRRSMQYAGTWNSNFTQVMQRILLYSSFLYFIWIFFFAKREYVPLLHKYLVAVILVALVANAFVCAGISMVDVRFQYRIAWLVPLIALCILAERFRNRYPINQPQIFAD